MPLSLFQYTIVSYGLLLPVILNLFVWNNSFVATIFGGVFVLFQSILWGQQIFPRRPAIVQILFGTLLLLLAITCLGTIIYFIWNLSNAGQSLVFIGIPVLGVILLKLRPTKQTAFQLDPVFSSFRNHLPKFVLFFIYLFLITWIFSLLFQARTIEAITSPWDVLINEFWVLYFISTVLWIFLLWKSKLKTLNFLLVAIHLFLSYSIAVIVYKLGYGFDPFIHQRAQEIIANQGSVLPKTPYYIGQYALVVSLHKLLGLSLLWIDRLLVPLLAAIGIPLLLSEWSFRPKREQLLTKKTIWLSLVFLLIPYSFLLSTTPQGLATLFFVFLILGSFALLTYREQSIPLWVLWVLGIASVMTHPLVGIPSIIFLTLLTHELFRKEIHHSVWLHRAIIFLVVLVGSLAMPLVFFINGRISPQLSARIRSLSELSSADFFAWFPLRVFLHENQFRSFFFEFGYFIQENIWWILSAIILIMIYWLIMRSKYSYLRVYGLSALIFLLNAIILSTFIDFPDLIQYENQAYAGRLFQTAFWAISPLLMLSLIWLWKRIEQRPITQFIFALGIAWLATGVLFTSYPRNNRYELGRQYGVSAADIATVQKIGQKKTDFVVLANQSVSAAAIQEFGFQTYFITPDQKQVFYYPVPTSSPLYDNYLGMVYDQPSRANAQKASELTGVSTVYFVLNEYWDNASQIAEQAKLHADEWVEIEGGKTIIFTYKF